MNISPISSSRLNPTKPIRAWLSTLGCAAISFGGLGACQLSPSPGPATFESTTTATPVSTRAEVLANSQPWEWRQPDPQRTLYLNLPAGRVVFELAAEFAPRHIDNLTTLVGQKYFDGLAIVRAQENYVVQWGDPEAATANARSLGAAHNRLAGEYFRDAQGLAITQLASRDAYANEVGFAAGFPMGRDGPDRRAWLLHCYGAFGVGRDVAADSGNAAELYVVIGHSPRHLDRNVTLIGRVIDGIELLSTLDRGQGDLSFYTTASQRTPIVSMRLASTFSTDSDDCGLGSTAARLSSRLTCWTGSSLVGACLTVCTGAAFDSSRATGGAVSSTAGAGGATAIHVISVMPSGAAVDVR